MSDSDDDMPGLGKDTTVAVKQEAVPKPAAKAAQKPAPKREKGPDVTIVGESAANKPVKVLKSALKKRGGQRSKNKVKVDQASTAPSAGTMNIIRKLQTGMRQHTKRLARQQKPAPTAAEEPVVTVKQEEEEQPKPEAKPDGYLGVADNKEQFVTGWEKVVSQFVQDADRKSYECPPGLNGYDRKMLHQLAEQYNLGHKSLGFGPERHLVLTKDRLFYDLGGLTPAQERLNELKRWGDMTKRFAPTSGRITAQTIARIEGEKEYTPDEAPAAVAKSTKAAREEEDYRQRVARLRKLREMNRYGVFSEKEDLSSYADLAPSAKRRKMAPPPLPPTAANLAAMPLAPPMSFTPPASVAGTESEAPASEFGDDENIGKAMQDFLSSGLAPQQVSIVRELQQDGSVEPLGLRFTKELLVTAVSGVAEECKVPVDMFINEVDGVDVVTPGEFTTAIKDKTEFTLTLWYLRKDGFTVERLKDIAARAEEALQKAVEGDGEGMPSGLPTCSACDSSRPLIEGEEEWEGNKKMFCSNCNGETDWVLEDLGDSDEEEEEDEEEEQVAF